MLSSADQGRIVPGRTPLAVIGVGGNAPGEKAEEEQRQSGEGEMKDHAQMSQVVDPDRGCSTWCGVTLT